MAPGTCGKEARTTVDTETTAVSDGIGAAVDQSHVMAEPPELAELRSLLKSASQGDGSVQPRLREILDAHPEVWSWYGDLARHAEEAYISLVCGIDQGIGECLRRKLAELKAELAGPSPTVMERLLTARVTATWMELNWADLIVVRTTADDSATRRQLQFLQDRRDRAERRHLKAMGALATLQRLLPASAQPAAVVIDDATQDGAQNGQLHSGVDSTELRTVGGHESEDDPAGTMDSKGTAKRNRRAG